MNHAHLNSLIERCRAYLAKNADGGNLQLVLDHGNLCNGFIIAAYHNCVETMDITGKMICDDLLELDNHTRQAVWNSVHELPESHGCID